MAPPTPRSPQLSGWIRFRRRAASTPILYGIPLLLGIVVCILPSLIHGIPVPKIDDEWGYLLGADTFVEGRLTNPTPPEADHFEARHQMVEPTRFTKYPPGQSAFLALGQLLGHPILGVWLGCLLLVFATVWLLRAIMPAPWAILGGFLTVTQFMAQGMPWSSGLPGYWSQSYWGGALAAAGGALLYGALLRVRRAPALRDALALTAGLALMATTRPKEGVIVALPAAVLLTVWLFRQRGAALRIALLRVVAPVVLGLTALLAFTTHYNKTLTGDPLKMPWAAHYEKYVVFPLFIWGETRTDVAWDNPDLEAFYNGWERELHERHQTLKGAASAIVSKVGRFVAFYFGPVLGLGLLLAAPTLLRRRGMQLTAIVGGLMIANAATGFAAFPHYSSPWTALCILACVYTLRQVRVLGRTAGLGRKLFVVSLVGIAGIAGWSLYRSVARVGQELRAPRFELQRRLEAEGGRHLILVRYARGYIAAGGAEYVFNPADLDEASVLWGRDLGTDKNARLLEAFPDRRAWRILVADGTTPELVPLR